MNGFVETIWFLNLSLIHSHDGFRQFCLGAKCINKKGNGSFVPTIFLSLDFLGFEPLELLIDRIAKGIQIESWHPS